MVLDAIVAMEDDPCSILVRGQTEACDTPASSSGNGHAHKLRIGCALLPKKVSRYLTPAMMAAASARGLELCLIDYTRPLLEQGRFDAIIHKLQPNKEWEKNLQEYTRANPNVKVIDRVDGIRMLQNRSTMLSALGSTGILFQSDGKATARDCSAARVAAPVQVEIQEGMPQEQVEALLRAKGLTPPLLVKSLWTDGREGSHGLAVVHDLPSLAKLLAGAMPSEVKPPVVVQQFVQHGGVLFKVYVLGQVSVVTRRPSLGDNYLGRDARRKGVMHLPRISCKSVHGTPTGGTPAGGTPNSSLPVLQPVVPDTCGLDGDDFLEEPPEWVTSTLAHALRTRLGLQLFNFDLICPEEQASPLECLYYVVDINYFPGVDKIPNFESMFVDFLLAACHGEGACSPDSCAVDCGKRAAALRAQPAAASAATSQSHSMQGAPRRQRSGASEGGGGGQVLGGAAVGRGEGSQPEPLPQRQQQHQQHHVQIEEAQGTAVLA